MPSEGQLKMLAAAASRFPLIDDPGANEDQKHVTVFIHGYDNSWPDACRRYALVSSRLFEGHEGLGIPVLFSWPSEGMPTHYLPDREHARACAADFADVLSELYDWLQDQQKAAAHDPKKAC